MLLAVVRITNIIMLISEDVLKTTKIIILINEFYKMCRRDSLLSRIIHTSQLQVFRRHFKS